MSSKQHSTNGNEIKKNLYHTCSYHKLLAYILLMPIMHVNLHSREFPEHQGQVDGKREVMGSGSMLHYPVWTLLLFLYLVKILGLPSRSRENTASALGGKYLQIFRVKLGSSLSPKEECGLTRQVGFCHFFSSRGCLFTFFKSVPLFHDLNAWFHSWRAQSLIWNYDSGFFSIILLLILFPTDWLLT